MKPRSQAIARRILGDNKQRITPQRALLLELIRRRRGHLDAHDLYTLAQKKYPRLSLSTVYRSLRLFKELGLIHELHFEEEHHHYEERPSREHYHLVCLGCGQIIEFESRRVAQMKGEMGREHGFEVVGAEIHLTGRCSQCRQQEGAAR